MGDRRRAPDWCRRVRGMSEFKRRQKVRIELEDRQYGLGKNIDQTYSI